MKTLLAISALLIFSSLVFADIGPGPAKPVISIKVFGGQQPYNGYLEMVFHCNEPGEEADNTIGEREVTLSCSNGACTNDQWFYKFNPCFSDSGGYLKYKTSENQNYRTTTTFSYETAGVDGELDIKSGLFQVSSSEPGSCAAGGAMMILLLLGILRWN